MLEIRKWYFGVNEKGLSRVYRQIRAAVHSCLANTPLKPYCIYSGVETKHIVALRKLGVNIIYHTPSLIEELRIGYGPEYETFVGHWLRTDIPLLETSEDFILYTDIDVLFLNWKPNLLDPPKYISAAPERNITDTRTFNSGVLVVNVPGMRSELARFHEAIRYRLLNKFRYPNHDQRSFNDYFRRVYNPLSPLMNWKPYWGRNDEASIVHFHGPKPHQVAKIRAGSYRGKRALADLWARDPQAYEHYCALWKSYDHFTVEGSHVDTSLGTKVADR